MWDMFFVGGWLNYTWLYRQHVFKGDEGALKAISNPRAAVNALEMQRLWNLNQRSAEGWKGKIAYTEKGDYRFEYPLYISTRINHLRDAIESRKGDGVVV